MKMRSESGHVIKTIRGHLLFSGTLPIVLALLFVATPPTTAESFAPEVINPGLAGLIEITPAEEELAVWVFFEDKGELTPDLLRLRLNEVEGRLSDRALARRTKTRSLFLVDARDIPVRDVYIEAVEELGARIRTSSKWLNAVSVDVEAGAISAIASLAFVMEVRPVASFTREPVMAGEVPTAQPFSKGSRGFDYGNSDNQVEMIDVPQLHDQGLDGSGVIVCMLDTGFERNHEALDHLDLIAEWDFINDDGNTTNESGDPLDQDYHGTLTLSTLGGFHEGRLIGPAYGASFLLAKTENTASEKPIEEDWWVEGIEWAEANGADVASSSLGYTDWYSFSDMDGVTAVTTIAADIAVENGVVVVNAMGNEGQYSGAIIAPADGFNVISCGAVTSSGYLTEFSSSGPTYDDRTKPEVCAQGSSVYAASNSVNRYTYVDGTSLSTPLVGGVVTLLLQAHPEWTPADVRYALMSTANRWWNVGNNYGWGVISALRAAGPPWYVCEDIDGDGFDDEACGGTDCDDANTDVNPSIEEIRRNDIDDDCDGRVDEWCFISLATFYWPHSR